MEYTTLGRTGLKVSVAGLGCGGVRRLGPGTGETGGQAVAPALLGEREKGKIRFLGVTELADPEHEMVRRAVEDGVWDSVMVAFHMIHQNACTKVFPLTIANRIGTLLMFVVRNIFSKPER